MTTAATGPGTATSTSPRWIQEVVRSLPVRPQIVLFGNVRDMFVVPAGTDIAVLPFYECLWRTLAPLGYESLVAYDKIDGIRTYPDDVERRNRVATTLDLKLTDGGLAITPTKVVDIARRLVNAANVPLAFIIDYASRLIQNPAQLTADEHDFFAAFDKLAYSAHAHVGRAGATALFNPIVWLAQAESDLPHWFIARNERVWSHGIPSPDYESRKAAAGKLLAALPGVSTLPAERQTDLIKAFADQTEGLTLTSMISVVQLARGEGLAGTEIEEAVLRYKVGVSDNPWKKEHVRERVRQANDFIATRVKGQRPAIIKTVDILKRSIAGLTGAHTSRRSGRPRGVLFFAGPTGVGKTELAKALTECLFNDERAYIRFDMSEFAADHSDARLLGAPPGYIGFDAGGELTNAIRSRPFSVVLFDEIEKAHPRILDKFLQVLEDGRLTDGIGQTVYFSEAVLIFTSNLGVYTRDDEGGMEETVKPGAPYDEVEQKIRGAVEHHFKAVLGRPELLNRIGDNIVVFDFIDAIVAQDIFRMMLENIVRRVEKEHGFLIRIDDAVLRQLEQQCTSELVLLNGGRGIANSLETRFVNPLARALFDNAARAGNTLRVVGMDGTDGVYQVHLQ